MKPADPQRQLLIQAWSAQGEDQLWPIQGRAFSLLVCWEGAQAPDLSMLNHMASSAIHAGARWVVCWGPWASLIEDSFIDAEAQRGIDDVAVTMVSEEALDDALWNAWHLFADDNPPVVALVPLTDPSFHALIAMQHDLAATFERVMEREEDS